MRRHASITSLLIAIASLPAFLMFVVVSVSIYVSRIDEVRADLDDRGRLLAAVLAEGSRYGVASGNVPALDATLKGMLATDPSIAGLAVHDAQRRIIACAGAASGPQWLAFEHPIRVQAIDADLFDSGGGPQGLGGAAPKVRDGAVVGHARVLLSPEPMMAATQRRLLFAASLVLAAALFGTILGVAMARTVTRPLARVMAALRSIQRGRFEVELDPHEHGELGELQRAILEMTRELAASRGELESSVALRTAELQQALQALRAADDEKRRLIAHGNLLVEDERRRIAGEIHDQLNASLISVRLLAASLKSRGEGPLPADEVDEAAARIGKTAEELYANARRIVRQLRPEVLDTLGLRDAVAEMVRHFDQVHPSCRFELRCEAALPPLPDAVAITVYRIVQEALSNVVKHAQAAEAVVTIARDDRRALVVTIADDGRGIETGGAATAGLGLLGMRERAAAVGGTLEIGPGPGPGGGTLVSLWLPVEGAAAPGTGPGVTPP